MTPLDPANTSPEAVLAELEALKLFFESAQTDLLNGTVVDMTGIDTRIGVICAIAKQAIPDQQKIYLPKLAGLIDLLNAYEKQLRLLQNLVTNIAPSTGPETGNGSANP